MESARAIPTPKAGHARNAPAVPIGSPYSGFGAFLDMISVKAQRISEAAPLFTPMITPAVL
jgi:hypothetical protein